MLGAPKESDQDPDLKETTEMDTDNEQPRWRGCNRAGTGSLGPRAQGGSGGGQNWGF